MWTSFGWGQRWWDRRSTWSGAATAWFSRLLVGPNTWGELYYKRSTDGGDNWGPDVWLDRAGDPAAGRATGQTAHGGKVKPPVDVETGIQQLVTTGILWANRSTL